MSIYRANTATAVDELIVGLRDIERAQPWCVVSTPFDSAVPRFDVEEIERQVGDLCAVFLLPTGDLSRRLSAGLPPHADAYGGAARSFPPGDEWLQNTRLTKLRWIPIPSQAAPMTERVIGDLFAMAYRSGLTSVTTKTGRPETGVVRSIVAGARGMVQLDSGGFATIVHELVFPDVPLEWTISPGQRVSGDFDPTTRRLTPETKGFAPTRLLDWYPDGSVTLALVLSVERQRATLAVHPAVPLVVDRNQLSSNPRDRADLLLTPGDVIAVRVIRDPQGRVALRTRDIDDDEPVLPPPSVFDGGEPWLKPDRPLSTPDDALDIVTLEDFLASNPQLATTTNDAPEPAAGDPADPVVADQVVDQARRAVPRPGKHPAVVRHADADSGAAPSSGALKTALATIDVLKAEVARLTALVSDLGSEHLREEAQSLRQLLGEALRERDTAKQRAASLDRSRRETQALLRQARSSRAASDPRGRRDRFAGDEEWIRHEIHLAWIDRLGATDRVRFPLAPSYRIGPGFASSLRGLDAGQFQKALRTVVDVLTGHVRELASRHVHPLREGTGASAADVTREDGAICYRAYVEQNTPSARRLHYWQTPSKQIELSRIVLHDDMAP